ncbi:MAG: efflux RND transporter periplasmic adaptor subunit [Verrucomicrobiae bacterium]|nr:efflux RND transporter periplasmic adaptor subunit [Verrucomicrobiae bacterium]
MKNARLGMVREPVAKQVFEELATLRRFTGPAVEFWQRYLRALGSLSHAHRGALVRREPGMTGTVRKLLDWSDGLPATRSAAFFYESLTDLAQKCYRQGFVSEVVEPGRAGDTGEIAVGVRLQLANDTEQCAVVFLLVNVDGESTNEVLTRLQLASDVPKSYEAGQTEVQAREEVAKLVTVLDVVALVNAETKFRSAALAFCNAIADRFRCERVSLGWVERGFVRLKTISRTDRFDKRTRAVGAIETVMEEAVDQDEEIIWPAPEGFTAVVRDHEQFAKIEGAGCLASVPLRLDGQPIAVITCERRENPFTDVELKQLRLASDLVTRRLGELRARDRWIGARMTSSVRERLGKVLGPEHTLSKLLVITGGAVLLGLLLPIYRYRVEGNFVLRSEEVAHLTAPFEGYIESVEVQPGDEAAAQSVLLKLSTTDLELEEALALADQARYLREAEKARAAGALADMRIALAMAEQSKARLDLIRYRITQAHIRAPFSGVVVEGDLRERIGAPVKQGESLFRFARLEPMYVEAEINERDIHHVLGKSQGEIAFVARPKDKYRIRVVRVEPAAIPKDKQNVFLVRCVPEDRPEQWWRPGMSGVCKVDVDRRSLIWLLTHRTMDFLRMYFWW